MDLKEIKNMLENSNFLEEISERQLLEMAWSCLACEEKYENEAYIIRVWLDKNRPAYC